MMYSRVYPLLVVFLVIFSQTSWAKSVEEEFAACAAFVLKDQISEEASFNVDLSQMDSSSNWRRTLETNKHSLVSLEMELTNGETGESIGQVRCQLTASGKLIDAEFIRYSRALASS